MGSTNEVLFIVYMVTYLRAKWGTNCTSTGSLGMTSSPIGRTPIPTIRLRQTKSKATQRLMEKIKKRPRGLGFPN